jgi:uncharacterized protein
MSEQERTTLLEFPCDFPIKVFGLSGDGFLEQVAVLVRRHAPGLGEGALTSRQSGGGKYTAVTVTVRAQSKAQLDAIYRELTACPGVVTVL